MTVHAPGHAPQPGRRRSWVWERRLDILLVIVVVLLAGLAVAALLAVLA